MPKMSTLTCAAGHTWERPAQRGRPPRFCPEHAGTTDPNSLAEQRRKVGISPPLPRSLVDDTCPLPDPKRAQLVTPIGTELPGLKPREWVHVSTVQPGDWTHITGYRPVKAVKLFPRRKEIKITWSDDSSETYGFTYVMKDDNGNKVVRDRNLWVLRKDNVGSRA